MKLYRFIVLFVAVLLPAISLAQDATITRRAGWLHLWNAISRPAFEVSGPTFVDVLPDDPGYIEIDYAKQRGFFPGLTRFSPDEPLSLETALIWLLRSRNLDAVTDISADNLAEWLEEYPLVAPGADVSVGIAANELEALQRRLDEDLAARERIVSYYGQEFAGDGTAFGETFDPAGFTAAHLYWPHDTLVKVTNLENNETVLVRINDRGPYTPGRYLDLSEAAFLSISPRSRGVINATVERLGDVNLVDPSLKAAWEAQSPTEQIDDTDEPAQPIDEPTDQVQVPPPELASECGRFARRYQRRLTKEVRFARGIPHVHQLGQEFVLQSTDWFVLRSLTLPDGEVIRKQQWIDPDEHYKLTPLQAGEYLLYLTDKVGFGREFAMTVQTCE